MTKMAQAFNTTVAALEDELTQLILEGLINARIDSHSKVTLVEIMRLSPDCFPPQGLRSPVTFSDASPDPVREGRGPAEHHV